MELYLVQHGEAESKEHDPERPLTDQGFQGARRMADHAARLGVTVAEVHHSGKLRARQTAEAFAEALAARVVASDGLSPNDDVEPLARELSELTDSLLIVGHLPHLAHLASRLLTGEKERCHVAFRNAGIVRLDRNADGRFELRWVLPPDVLIE